MLSKRLTDYAQPAGKQYLPNNSADCVIFGYHEKQLKILCTRVSGINGWLLPGGFIKKNEPLDDAANRVLIERTGLKGLFLKQFYTFGNTNRSWKKIHRNTLQKKIGAGSALPLNWMSDRYISTGYYALTEFSKVNPKPALIESECRWFDHDHLPGLLLDHSEMVKKAFVTLRLQIHHEPIGYNLLPEKFTLPEFQALYETLLGKKLDHRNFTKKIMSMGIIKKLNEKKKIGAHRSPSLYKFNKHVYNDALKKGIEIAF